MKFDIMVANLSWQQSARVYGLQAVTDSPVAFWYVQGHRNGRSWVRTPVGTGGASKTATGMAHFSIMWQGPPTMADEAFPDS